MALTAQASERNADARVVLMHVYQAQLGRGGQVIADFGESDDGVLGMTRRRCLDAAERLVERGLFKRVGLTAYSIAPRGVDTAEDPDELGAVLPVVKTPIAVAAPKIASRLAHVHAALADADAAILRGEPSHAVDRVHTALHARVRELCDTQGIALAKDASLPAAFSALWSNPPNGAKVRPEGEKVLRSLGGVVEGLSTLRNRASLAHPAELPDAADALLAINAARTVAAYLEARFGST